MTVCAWHGEPLLKEMALVRMREHQRLERITQGNWWVDGNGCQLGCLIQKGISDFFKDCVSRKMRPYIENEIERVFGISAAVSSLSEFIFECLPLPKARKWAVDFLEKIPVGAILNTNEQLKIQRTYIESICPQYGYENLPRITCIRISPQIQWEINKLATDLVAYVSNAPIANIGDPEAARESLQCFTEPETTTTPMGSASHCAPLVRNG